MADPSAPPPGCVCVRTFRHIAMDARAYKGQSNAVETDKDGRRFVTAPDGYKYVQAPWLWA